MARIVRSGSVLVRDVSQQQSLRGALKPCGSPELACLGWPLLLVQ